jgi:hypothetical protein
MLLRRTVLATPLLACLPAARAAAVGQPAPDFSLADTDGRSVRLSDFRGRLVVLEWTHPQCPFVKKHYDSGNLPATQRDAVARGVAWLCITSTDKAHSEYLPPAALAAWRDARRANPTAILMDEEGLTGKAYGARTTPHLYIVSQKGGLVYAGGMDSIASSRADDIARATNYVRQGLAELLAGQPVSTPTTRPYGCSVKYKV